MQPKHYSLSSLLLAVSILPSPLVRAAVEPVCISWFTNTKVTVSDPECVSKCSIASVDLGTFNCTSRCYELCRPKTTCGDYRKMLTTIFSDVPPQAWDEVSEKTKPWKISERKLAIKSVLSLPRKLIEKSAFKIHRMPIAKFKKNPAATKGHDISLYDAAFRSGTPLARILAHEAAHVYWNDMKTSEVEAYRIAANWIRLVPSQKLVPGRAAKTFTEPDGMLLMTEDFANNVEYLLFDPDKLKKLTPSLFQWFRATLGDSFVLGGECESH